MTRLSNVFVVSAVVLAAECLTINLAYAEGEKSIAASLDVQVFPSGGQASSQQSKDEGTCYDWAVQNTGVDPFKVSKNEQAPAPQTSRRTGGAVRGAAAGAIIGEIANDDAGKGAAIGATAGLIRGRRQAREAEAVAQAGAEKSAAANEQQMGSFKKGFAACLKGKKYTVEY